MAKTIINEKYSTNQRNTTKINDAIDVPEVRLIGSDGQLVGIVSTTKALSLAIEEDLDLVLVSEDANPPVCKILNYGKYRYALQKKKNESKKKQKIIEIKEVQLRPFIGENDLLIKCKAIQKFVLEGNRVKVVLRFRGRELSRTDSGFAVINKVLSYCEDFAKSESTPKLEGSVIAMTLTKK